MPSPEPLLMGVRIAPTRGRALDFVMRYEFARFLAVGAVAALANLLSAWCYRLVLRNTASYFEVSVALGFSVGTVVSFLLNKFFTFRAYQGKTWAQALRFALIATVLVALSTAGAHLILQGLVALPGMAENMHRDESLAHIATIGAMTVFNYFVIKYVAFTKTGTIE